MAITRTALALTCLLVSSSVSAWTPRRTEPTAGANLIAYQLNVGSTMKRTGDAEELFAGDATGYGAFKARAEKLIVSSFEQRGIASAPDSLATKARSHFSVGVWGHKISTSVCDNVYVYYLMAHGVHQTEDGEFRDTWEWTALDSSVEDKLASSVLESLNLALVDYLSDRPLKRDTNGDHPQMR
jgi:hypothetical protein